MESFKRRRTAWQRKLLDAINAGAGRRIARRVLPAVVATPDDIIIDSRELVLYLPEIIARIDADYGELESDDHASALVGAKFEAEGQRFVFVDTPRPHGPTYSPESGAWLVSVGATALGTLHNLGNARIHVRRLLSGTRGSL